MCFSQLRPFLSDLFSQPYQNFLIMLLVNCFEQSHWFFLHFLRFLKCTVVQRVHHLWQSHVPRWIFYPTRTHAHETSTVIPINCTKHLKTFRWCFVQFYIKFQTDTSFDFQAWHFLDPLQKTQTKWLTHSQLNVIEYRCLSCRFRHVQSHRAYSYHRFWLLCLLGGITVSLFNRHTSCTVCNVDSLKAVRAIPRQRTVYICRQFHIEHPCNFIGPLNACIIF